jgi:hypothetical protein
MPLARLVFVPQHDGRLHRCAIDAIEAGNGLPGRGMEAKGEYGSTPSVERTGGSIPGGDTAPAVLRDVAARDPVLSVGPRQA